MGEWKSAFALFHSNEGCTTAHPDKAADKEIADLKVFCPNKVNGCTWSERLKFLQVRLFLICHSLISLVFATFFLIPCKEGGLMNSCLFVHMILTSFYWNMFIRFF